ncbi:MAG: EAL domain-containing protein [Sterolibacterium sp.]|jgi:diguanylate cyclase (GGDEF)-like protein/PAS domain S-box-containing protein
MIDRWKNNALLQPGIRRDFALIFLLYSVLGIVATIAFSNAIDRHITYTRLIDDAGRLRMLSQRIAYQAHHVDAQTTTARLKLSQLVDSFDENLDNLTAQSNAVNQLGGGPTISDRSLATVSRQWKDFRAAAIVATEQPVGSPQSLQALSFIDQNSESLLNAADENVKSILSRSIVDYQQVQRLLPLAMVLGIIFAVGAYLYILKRFLVPFTLIRRMSQKLAQGEFHARVEQEAPGDVGKLINTLNLTADAMQEMFHERVHAEEIARESDLRNRAILETSHDAVVVTDARGVITYANLAVEQVFGRTPEELIGSEVFMLYPERVRKTHFDAMIRYLTNGVLDKGWQSIETWALQKSGKEFPVELSVNYIRLPNGDMFAGFFRDLTARREMLEDLRLRNRAIESASEAIMISDAQAYDHPTIYVNPAFERLTGYAMDEALGRNGRILLDNEVGQQQTDALRHLLKEGREGTVVLKCFRKNGDVFWNELSVSPVRNSQGTVTHSISIFKDVTERKREEESLVRNAQYDGLTGLPNGILFLDRLQHAISSALRHERMVGVLFIDIDHFKTVNDTFGRNSGDRVLLEAAQRLLGGLRDGDTVARLGSDEFVLLLDELEREDDIEPLAERIMSSMSKAFMVEGQEIFISASIGASVFPRDGEDGQELIRNADLAMYRAKQYGRNIFQAFSEDMQSNITQRMTMDANLRRALERDELVLHYQPQLNLANGRIVGAEALIRWVHPELGMVSPIQFIPLAEESGLIVPIGEWVIDTACRQVRLWRDEGTPVPRVAVNISARQFRQKNLLSSIERSLSAHGLDASVLEIELTESMVMHDPDRTIQILREMREMGLHISLDDFGTGYSSLSYLRRFPIDVLKVDQSFVRDVTTNPDDAAIAASIIALAHGLNLTTVAEGVETAGQMEYLVRQKCDVMQGFFFSKPLPAARFAMMLKSGQNL